MNDMLDCSVCGSRLTISGYCLKCRESRVITMGPPNMNLMPDPLKKCPHCGKVVSPEELQDA